MAKRNLLGDCVLRRDAQGNLWLMNRQEGGWRSWSNPVKSEEALLEEYNVRLGEWTRDSCSEYCPVTCIPRSELPTLHDWEEHPTESFKAHDVGQRGQSTESVDASRERIMQFYERTLIPNLPNWTEGYNFFHPGKKT